MSIYEKIQEEITSGISSGVEASKKLFEKAKTAATEMEESSIVRLDLRKLKAQKKELTAKLGDLAYEAFFINGRKSLTMSSAGVAEICNELKNVEDKIAEKEACL